ncbi:MAG: substrate-binding domain-containing protein [Dysgonamonadaceae bacterium]|nr:substrate-binding domain-containing protein [Dysgonamonadaceae bacterium]
MRLKGYIKIIFPYLFILLLVCVSCRKPVDDGWSDTMDGGLIRIACDESFQNLMDAEIAAFEIRYDSAYIIPIYTNETNAIRLMLSDSVRFALTTRDINSQERRAFEDKKRTVKKSLVAFDGVALIANLRNQDSIIGLPNLKKILTGDVTEWSQINPASKLGTIRVLFEGNESGVLRYALDSIIRGGNLSPNLYALNNSAEVIEKVTQMPGAIGLIGFSLLSDETNSSSFALRNKIRLIRVSKSENATLENSYLPYAGNIIREDYPLWRPVYVLLSDPRSGLSSAFSIFVVNEIGQKVIQKSGLLTINGSHIMDVAVRNEFPEKTMH